MVAFVLFAFAVLVFGMSFLRLTSKRDKMAGGRARLMALRYAGLGEGKVEMATAM